MRILAIVVVLALVLVAAVGAVLGRLRPPELLAVPERGVVFADVTVVNPGSERAPGRTLRVEGDRIAAVGAGPAESADLRGGFLLPGLVDVHVHDADASIAGQPELFSMLYLAHGVTSVRNTGGGSSQLDWRERVTEGEVAGPRVFACGPLYDGSPPIWSGSVVVETPEQAREEVDRHLGMGYDCLKVYERLSAPVLAALVDAAHSGGLRVVGHVPDRVRFEDAGIDDVQHLRGLARIGAEEPALDLVERVRGRWRRWAALTPERIEFVVRTSLEQGVSHTPTLGIFARGARLDRVEEELRDPALELLPRFYGAIVWEPRGVPWFDAFHADDWAVAKQTSEAASHLVEALFRAGVRIHAGTDVGNPFLVPGASLHEELTLLVDAGLSPEEAWLTATRWPGEFLGEPGLGVVTLGAPADLLLFDEDPTRDLAALSTLRAVVADGRLYRREQLDAALERSRLHYRGWLYERVSMAIGERRRAAALREMAEAPESS